MNWPHLVIEDKCHPEIGPLMIRYYLLRTRWVGVFLHHFLRSDRDRHCHDHPWAFITLLLSGGYFEHTPAGTFWRRRFSVLFRPAVWQHWVEVRRPVWTLVVRFRRVRMWGFWTEEGFVDWQTYDREWCE